LSEVKISIAEIKAHQEHQEWKLWKTTFQKKKQSVSVVVGVTTWVLF
jgi:hypothetical protein